MVTPPAFFCVQISHVFSRPLATLYMHRADFDEVEDTDMTFRIRHNGAGPDPVSTLRDIDPQQNPLFRLQGLDRARNLRVALYSHDTMGLGHARRNLLIAQAISESFENADILLITGNRETTTFPMPERTDCLTMPSIHKAVDGSYRARRLDVPLHDLIRLRSGLIDSALETFQPDLFIVDNVPRGVSRELDPVLERLRQRGTTRCVLGLRDVLDSPQTVAWEWARKDNYEAIRRYFDQVWVFGDREIYDPVAAYGFPADIAERFRFAGYLDQRARLSIARAGDADPLASFRFSTDRLALCVVGGGQDGAQLAETFVRSPMPEGMHGIVLTGPFMPDGVLADLYQVAAQRDDMGVLEFVPEPGVLMARADRVVAMGGYNTICEVLSHEKTALIVPRVVPRQEQLIRARRMSNLGLFDMCHPDDLCPEAIGAWLASPAAQIPAGPDLLGVHRLPALVDGVLPVTAAIDLERADGEEQCFVAM